MADNPGGVACWVGKPSVAVDDTGSCPSTEKKMAANHSDPTRPDLALGIALSDLPDGGKLVGHRDGEPVLLLRRGSEIFAIAANCSHYGGPLADGLVADDRPLPLASRLLWPAHRRGPACSGVIAARMLVG